MDWMSSSLENSILAKAPMWLLITQVYWKDLLKSRKYGRRLVAALCDLLQSVRNILFTSILGLY
jgi:mediator of RNA polymerase II transcription subunit 12